MSKEAMKLALEALEMCEVPWTGTLDHNLTEAITALREALAEQPAQQEPLTDIYCSFEQWKSGNVLERGVPRTEYYSEAQLDLVEMGWNYGYDAGRAVEQALDKKAENARKLGLDYEPAQEPQRWAVFCQGCQKEWSVSYPHPGKSICSDCDDKLAQYSGIVTAGGFDPRTQRTWVGLTDEEIQTEWVLTPQNDKAEGIWFGRRIEAKLKEKNQ